MRTLIVILLRRTKAETNSACVLYQYRMPASVNRGCLEQPCVERLTFFQQGAPGGFLLQLNQQRRFRLLLPGAIPPRLEAADGAVLVLLQVRLQHGRVDGGSGVLVYFFLPRER